MFEGYKKYFLVRYCWDCGTDDGMDADTKKLAEHYARQDRRDGWETVACINTEKKRIEFVLGKPCNVLSWFVPACADVLRQNTTLPKYVYAEG